MPTTPEDATVAAHHLALECVGLAVFEAVEVVGQAERVVQVGRGHGAQGLPDEVGQVACEHAARRAVHPGDAVGVEGDDAHKNRVQDRAGAIGLQGQVPFGAVAGVDVHEGGDEAFFRSTRVDQPHRHLGPQGQARGLHSQRALALPVTQAAQHTADVGLGVEVELRGVQRLQRSAGEVGVGLADQVGQGGVGPLDVAVPHEGDAHA